MIAPGANAGNGSRSEATQPVRFEPLVLFHFCEVIHLGLSQLIKYPLILFTTKLTKDTKVSEILVLNFVLFVSFVVNTIFA